MKVDPTRSELRARFQTRCPAGKKRIFIYNKAHHPTDITRCERESVCACVEEGGGGGGGGRRGVACS